MPQGISSAAEAMRQVSVPDGMWLTKRWLATFVKVLFAPQFVRPALTM